jgi:hypothetical protein
VGAFAGIGLLAQQSLVHHRDVGLNPPDGLIELRLSDHLTRGAMNVNLHRSNSLTT